MSAAAAAMRRLRFSRELVLLGVLIALIVVMSLLSPLFFTLGNLLNTSRYFVEVGLMALGMTLIIVTGGIDLSVGRTWRSSPWPSVSPLQRAFRCRWPSCSALWSGWLPGSSTASS